MGVGQGEKLKGKRVTRFPGADPRRAPLNMKTTKELRARLEAAATLSGRTLTHEVEHRIERSFLMDDVETYVKGWREKTDG